MEVNLEEITHHASWVMIIFLIGYTAIVIEQVVKFNKSATALLMAVFCWTVLFLEPEESLERHLFIFTFQMFKTSQVLFFLIGALTIVEIINVHKGFQVITDKLLISSKKMMLWTASILTFFLSSVLDNLTTTIVMVSLMGKIVKDREERLILCGLIVIAANAGGTWTPIGDISTTLLWINGQISTLATVRDLFLPSFASLLVPLIWFSFKFKGEFEKTDFVSEKMEPGATLVLILGVCSLIFVPLFRVLTGLPPFMAVLFGLGLMWVLTDLLHYKYQEREHLRVTSILPKIDISIVLFYLGILLSVNSLESAGLLRSMAEWLELNIPSVKLIPILIGLISAIVDNVSLVAGAIAMYSLDAFPQDSTFWQMVTYCAGTGGSILIIGSAAGVALMAIERVDFMWYTKRITFPALLAYIAGLAVYFLLSPFTQMLI